MLVVFSLSSHGGKYKGMEVFSVYISVENFIFTQGWKMKDYH